MDTLILHRFGAFKYSSVVSFFFENDGSFFACPQSGNPQRLFPYDLDELRQSVRDGKLDSGHFGALGGTALSATTVNNTEQNSNLPALLFLVADCEGNVELCETAFLSADFVSSPDRSIDFTACSDKNIGVNHAAFLGNFNLCVGNAFENFGQDFGYKLS